MSSKGRSIVEHLLKQTSFGSLLGGPPPQIDPECLPRSPAPAPSPRPSPLVLSGSPRDAPSANLPALVKSVIERCGSIILLSSEELCSHFEEEVSESAKNPSNYARNLLEYCCFKALAVVTQVTDYLSEKKIRRLTFDMMLAWETSGAACDPSVKVDPENTIGQLAFVRLGPAISGVADTITAHSQFDALTVSSRGRLSFPVYEKYLGELEKTIKLMKNLASPSQLANLQLAKGESVIEVDGTVTTQPVLEHSGVSTWPGRLTLTDHALYFESIGVVSYNECKKMDLSSELRQVIKPELTGPWGTRLFDKAISYKSCEISDPVLLEFPELTGHSRRDYWLAITCEVLTAHVFARKFQLDATGQIEALSKAVLGIARLRATREAIRALPPQPELLLTFSAAEKVPGGDLILMSLAQKLHSRDVDVLDKDSGGGFEKKNTDGEKSERRGLRAISAAATLASLGSPRSRETGKNADQALSVGEFLIGDLTPLEKAVSESRDNSKRVKRAQASIDEVKVDGIDTNLAVLKELLKPLNTMTAWIKALQSWNEPFKTSTFLIICSYLILRNLGGYVLPFLLVCFVIYVIWFQKSGIENEMGKIQVALPPKKNKVEQFLVLQEGLSALEGFLQTCNIFLLKVRALLFSRVPKEATDQMVFVLSILAVILAILPFKLIVLLLFWEFFTRYMPLRQESTERYERRLREWWYSIPVVSVHLTKPDEDKKKK